MSIFSIFHPQTAEKKFFITIDLTISDRSLLNCSIISTSCILTCAFTKITLFDASINSFNTGSSPFRSFSNNSRSHQDHVDSNEVGSCSVGGLNQTFQLVDDVPENHADLVDNKSDGSSSVNGSDCVGISRDEAPRSLVTANQLVN